MDSSHSVPAGGRQAVTGPASTTASPALTTRTSWSVVLARDGLPCHATPRWTHAEGATEQPGILSHRRQTVIGVTELRPSMDCPLQERATEWRQRREDGDHGGVGDRDDGGDSGCGGGGGGCGVGSGGHTRWVSGSHRRVRLGGLCVKYSGVRQYITRTACLVSSGWQRRRLDVGIARQ